MDLLRKEVKRLEDLRLADLSDVFANDVPVHDTQTVPSIDGLEGVDHRSELAARSDISSLMWQLKIGESGETSFVGPSGNFCFSASNDVPPRPVGMQRIEGAERPSRPPSLASEHEAAEAHLLAIFAERINPVHQFVDAETLAAIRAGTDCAPEYLKLAILSAAALFSDDARSRAYGDDLASRLETTVLTTCRQKPDVNTVQTLSILCWRELGLDHESMFWMYNCMLMTIYSLTRFANPASSLAMACSLATHLGLPVSDMKNLKDVAMGHKETGSSNALRIRAFWSVFLLDRQATIKTVKQISTDPS